MKKYILICGLMYLVGCASVPPAVIPPVSQLKPITINNDDSKLIFISDIRLGFLNTTESVGQYTVGNLCTEGKKFYFIPQPTNIEEYKNVLKENLERYGYRVASDLFKEDSSTKADILIGARFINVKGNICHSSNGYKGEIYMLIEWEIYDKETQDILKIRTEGYGNEPEFTLEANKVYDQAFSMAAINLIANEKFYKKAHLDK